MYKFSVLSLGLAATLFASCGGGGKDLTKHVPENAVAVGTFDMGALLKKANFERFSQTPEYKKAVEKAKEPHRKYLLNPSETGFDMAGTGVFYTQVTDDIGTQINTALLFPIKDGAKFDQFFQTINANKDFTEPVEKKGYKFSTPSSKVDELFMAWDKKMFVVGYVGGVVPSPEKELIIERIFKPEGKSINNNPDFAKQAKLKKDIMFWASTDSYFKQLLAGETGPTVKMGLGFFGVQEADLTGNSLAAYHDFQNGKWEGTTNFTFSAGLKSQFGGIFKDKPSQTFEKYLPAEKLAVSLSAALDLSQLYQALAKRRLQSRLDAVLTNFDFTSKELFNALSGEGCVAVYPKLANKENNLTDNVPNPDAKLESKEQIENFNYSHQPNVDFDVIFVSGVKDVAIFNKLLSKPEIAMLVKKQADIYVFNNPQEGGKNAYIYLSDKLILISTTEAPAVQAAKGGYSNSLPAAIPAQMKKGWASFYVDMAVLSQFTADNQTDANLSMDAAQKALFNEIVDYSGFAQGSQAVIGVELKSKDKNFLERYIELLIAAANK